MTWSARWMLAALVLFIVVYYGFLYRIEPECPTGSVAKLTRQGWYCTVRPIG